MNRVKGLVCYNCGEKFSFDQTLFGCPQCEHSLDIEYDYSEIGKIVQKHKKEFLKQHPSHWKYWMFYPVREQSRVTMGEGGTALVQSREHEQLMFKNEALNPTGSFKDRGSAVELSRVRELKKHEVACASTGNMGASVAAYCSRVGIKAHIYVPSFAPRVKLLQMKMHGAKVQKIAGSYEKVLQVTRDLHLKKGIYLTGDYPMRGEGEKSVGFEIMDQCEWKAPECVIAPIGNGTLIYGIYKAMAELKEVGLAKKIPKIIGVQAKNCNPVYRAYVEGLEFVPIVKNPKTVATAIACGYPVDGKQALNAVKKSKGEVLQVSEIEIMSARKELAKEGLFAEPAGAVAYAGFRNLHPEGKTVCVITGHGLKDPFR